MNELEFCDQKQLQQLFVSENIKNTYIGLWKESILSYKSKSNNIPLMYCNNKFLKFDASEWIPMSKDDVEKMIDFLHKKVLQQLSIYQRANMSKFQNDTF